MQYIINRLKDLSHLFFPHLCAGCGTDIIDSTSVICIRCMDDLAITNFHLHADNLAEKNLRGRIPVTHVSSLCYFSKDSLVRRLMHQIKYKGHKDLGHFMGRMMGTFLREADWFADIDALIPLPLSASREKRRGYNQAALLCEGMASSMHIPVWKDVVKRTSFTHTQTTRSRSERWRNMEGRFELLADSRITGRHLLLVDDVMTTGATLEACGQELLKAPGVRLSIATLACAVN